MTRFPRHLSSALMLLCVSIVCITVSLADTVIKDPDGWTLEFGKSVLQVNLNPADRQAAGSTGETACIFLGMINGRCAVADPAQTSGGDAATNHWGKIYLVDLLGTTVENGKAKNKARFSGLDQDIVRMPTNIQTPDGPVSYSPSLFFTENKFYHPYTTTKDYGANQEYKGTPRCQVLQYVNPLLPNQETKVFMLLNKDTYLRNTVRKWATNGYVAEFSLQTNTNAGLNELQLASRQFNQFAPSKSAITSIDLIDVNQWATASNAISYPPLLMVWYNREVGRSFIPDGYNEFLPDRLSSWAQDSNGNWTPGNISQMQLPDQNRIYAHGGFLTAPDGKGGLAYYFAQNEYERGVGWSYVRSTVCSMPISCQGSTLRLGTPSVFSQNSERFYGKIDGAFEAIIYNGIFNQYLWTGIGIDFDDPVASPAMPPLVTRKVRVRPQVLRNFGGGTAAWDYLNEDGIGHFRAVDNKAIKEVNAALSPLGGPIPGEENAWVTRAYRTGGVKVSKVILGWPYVALSVDRNGQLSTANTNTLRDKTKFTVESNTVTTLSDSFNNGVSTSWQLGVGVKTKITEAAGGIKGSYQYMAKNDTKRATTFSHSGTYTPVGQGDYSLACGVVGYDQVGPQVSTMGFLCWGNPNGLQTNITIGTDTNFAFPLLSTTAGELNNGISQPMLWQPFLLSDPSKLPSEDYVFCTADYSYEIIQTNSSYAPLSAGLVTKPFGNFIPVTNVPASGGLPAINQWTNFHSLLQPIRQWQSSNTMVNDLEQFRKAHAGVEAVADQPQTDSQFLARISTKITRLHEASQTKSHQGSVGFFFETKPNLGLGPYVKGEVLYNGGRSESTSEQKGATFTYDYPACDGPVPSNAMRRIYSYFIDVPALKSYMATHTYPLGGVTYTNKAVRPNFIPIYCWTYDQNFELIFPWIK